MENNLEQKKETDSFTTLQNEQKSNKKKRNIIITVILGFVILGIGIGYYLYQKARIYENQLIELSEEERQAEIANLFSVSAYDAIPQEYKEHIYHFLNYNSYLDGTYFLTKIDDRAKNVFAFGDFTNDDNDYDDMAVVFENNDFKSARLVIFNHKGELLFVEDYENELPVINSFKVGSKIYMDETKLVPSPADGLILKTPHTKKAVVYDKKNKKFNSYYQYTKEDIEAMEAERYYENYDYDDDTPEEATLNQQRTEEFIIQEVN